MSAVGFEVVGDGQQDQFELSGEVEAAGDVVPEGEAKVEAHGWGIGGKSVIAAA
ncbi:hypothetical protein [Leptolyngbya sp. FACHB-261]|uniref:hypothetical protein n=1 Tax=Leptolyngbya sp. FACHB-261 TaxID=2692806 RepID=UPI001687754C|nr:hypothetical protein [Leptolyngbya sp. FACHB-261]MBD2100378.1 hypothetical protein [Leptolyngbya sp. FACHB-261]